MPPKKPVKEPETKADTNSGAAAALRWLEAQESQKRKIVEQLQREHAIAQKMELEAPPEMDGVDFLARSRAIQKSLDDATDAHLKLLKALREFDKAVDPAKRDASESITRTEGERVFRNMAIYAETAFEHGITKIIPEIREAKDEQAAFEIACNSLKETLLNCIASAVEEQHLPQWALNSIKAIL